MITKSYFEYLIWRETLYRPTYIRRGQAVFNAVDAIFGVAREVQFIDGIDCFYDDLQIEAFLDAAYRRFVKNEEDKIAQTCVGR